MRLTAEIYRVAAEELVTSARFLHEGGFYSASHYLCGLSVECILRAYRFRSDSRFDARHDLNALFKISGLEVTFPQSQRSELEGYFAYIAKVWNNNHRFFSDEALRSHLKRMGLYYEIKRGDLLKENSRRMVAAASRIVGLGVKRWKIWKES